MNFPFPQWAPDRVGYAPDATDIIANALPTADGYRPLPSLQVYSSALSGACRGGILARGTDGAFHVFVATTTALWKLTTTGWTDVSGAVYTGPPTGENWSFEQFGDIVIAVNINDAPQQFTIASSTDFANLGGSPPQARYVGVSGDYLFLLSTSANPNRLYRSATGNAAFWTPKQRSSDFQDIPSDGGKILGMAGFQASALIFAQKSIHLYQDQPGPLLFTLKEAEAERTTMAPQSIAFSGNKVFYLAEDGFYKFEGGASVSIGAERVDRTFLTTLADPAKIDEVQSTIDPVNKLVAWLYTNQSGTKQIIAYNWQLDKWVPAYDVGADYLIRVATAGYTLEEIASVLLFTNLDAITTLRFDDRSLLGGRPSFAAINTANKVAFFSGAAMEATLETAELLLGDGERAVVNGFQSMGDVSGAYGRIGRNEIMGGTLDWTNEVAQTSRGFFPIMASGRGLKFRQRIPAGTSWSHATGIKPQELNGAGR